MCLSVSGRLRLRRSPTKRTLSTQLLSRYGDDTPSAAIRRRSGVRIAARASTARFLGRPAQLDQLRDDGIAVIALDFDDAVAHGAPRPTAFLELSGERVDVGLGQRQPRHRRDPLAGPTLDLTTDTDSAWFCHPGSALWTHAFPHCTTTIGTEAPQTSGVDYSCRHARIMPIWPARRAPV
jgi:hypothetical protein